MATTTRRRILYVHKGTSSFVLKDQRILEAVFDVRVLAFVIKRKWAMPFALLAQFFTLVVLLPRVDAVVCQFAGHHALLPVLMARLFGRKSVIIANGSDCVGFPSLDYGHFRKPLLAWSSRMCFMRCHRIVPLDETLVYHVPTYHDIDPPAQGIKHFCPGITTPITPLGYGFDPEHWRALGERKPMRFLTVASGAHRSYVRILKGLDMIMAVAPRFPEAEFLIVGARKGSLPDKPANVVEVPFVPHSEIAALYGSATYYLQLSVSEGFGNALCEAMLCGCVPIVGDTGAMPRIIGDTGWVVRRRTPDDVEAALRSALAGAAARDPGAPRERISTHFPDRLRATGLPSIVLDTIADR